MFAFLSRSITICDMKLFSRIFASFLLSTFAIFLASPIFTFGLQNQNTIILSTNFSETCNWNIQCESSPDGQYICHSTTESITSQWWSIRHVPTGKQCADLSIYIRNNQFYSLEYINTKNITYIWPDRYIYPFVGIIKIQV